MKMTIKIEGADKLAGELKKEADKLLAEEVRKLEAKQRESNNDDGGELRTIDSELETCLTIKTTPTVKTTPTFSTTPKISSDGSSRKKP
jgi:hypothetical protein